VPTWGSPVGEGATRVRTVVIGVLGVDKFKEILWEGIIYLAAHYEPLRNVSVRYLDKKNVQYVANYE
jgi:hypothetical protein